MKETKALLAKGENGARIVKIRWCPNGLQMAFSSGFSSNPCPDWIWDG